MVPTACSSPRWTSAAGRFRVGAWTPARTGRARFSGEAGMKELLTLGQMLAVHARLHCDRPGARDLDRAMTFRQWDERACRLANALLGLGLAKGDRVAILAYNC